MAKKTIDELKTELLSKKRSLINQADKIRKFNLASDLKAFLDDNCIDYDEKSSTFQDVYEGTEFIDNIVIFHPAKEYVTIEIDVLIGKVTLLIDLYPESLKETFQERRCLPATGVEYKEYYIRKFNEKVDFHLKNEGIKMILEFLKERKDVTQIIFTDEYRKETFYSGLQDPDKIKFIKLTSKYRKIQDEISRIEKTLPNSLIENINEILKTTLK